MAVISFPNFLCILLGLGALVVHMVTREPVQERIPKLEDMEEVYCKFPQSFGLEDSMRCISAYRLFWLLGNKCTFEEIPTIFDQVTVNETISEETESLEEEMIVEVVGETEPEAAEVIEEQPEEELKSSLVDSFVISLLVCSAIASLLEWRRERIRNSVKVQGSGENSTVAKEPSADRRISLADLTVNRHIRRQDSLQQESIRQNSVASGSRPPLIRRSSFPAQMPEVRVRHSVQRQQSTPGVSTLGRRMSVDLVDDDMSPDRRRVRIIRRH